MRSISAKTDTDHQCDGNWKKRAARCPYYRRYLCFRGKKENIKLHKAKEEPEQSNILKDNQIEHKQNHYSTDKKISEQQAPKGVMAKVGMAMGSVVSIFIRPAGKRLKPLSKRYFHSWHLSLY